MKGYDVKPIMLTALLVLLCSPAVKAEELFSEAEKTEMIDSACTPKGITIEGIKYLNQNKTKETIKKALEKTTEKSKEIEKELI